MNFQPCRKPEESISVHHVGARGGSSGRENKLALPLWEVFVIINLLRLN